MKQAITKQDVERRLRQRGWIRLAGEFTKGKWGVLVYAGPVALLGLAGSDDALATITPGVIEYHYGPVEDVVAIAESVRRAMA